ncbi:unnamed protein product [Cyprideis torosa]|uniref:non-specific protein-tyrosine kinase n=1 Tax=Cyprideis torosa TaxID=163714 RepID=A0A7R8WXR8_9CRUS|nr:unnamed protein product [Cyprideis torosa]CAG0908105.1 unnamed protein product [Cyprideis torosa]
MFGIGLAFLLAHLDNTVNNGEEVERITGYPCLGMVPLYKDNKQVKGELAKDNIEFKLEFITQQHRNSDVAEAIRSIRANLMFASVKGLPKTILFTSTVPQEGKSTLAINMAAAVAESGQRTLLIDCDLRKPRVHSVFGFPSSPGLSDALISQNLAMYPSSIKDLDILTAGTRPLNPTELLGSKEFKQLLNQFEESYDHIIIDGAPLLGLADSIMLSTQVDGVVYVVKGGETNKEWVKNGVKRLKTVNAPVLGIVLNQVEVKGKDYGYYQEYYKQYGVDS